MRALTLALLGLPLPAQQVEPPRPNILFILADDLGYGDLGCMGSTGLRTPQLDALARSGVRCNQAYVTSPVCSPSRAGLITGRDPRRFGYQSNLNKAAASYPTRPELLGLPPGEHSLGDQLRAAGYATALVGKWHLGTQVSCHPNRRGFDHFCGMLEGGHRYFPTPDKHRIQRNGTRVTRFSSPYLTDFFSDEALRWIERDHGKPWFLFLSYNAPHTPMQARAEDLARFDHIRNQRRRTYAAMVWALDRGIGRIRTRLQQRGILQNTLIVLCSDNGGATNNGSWNGPLSGCKGNLREGGLRVPMFWSWPGTLPGNTSYDQPCSTLDLLPSFLAAAGGKPLALRAALPHEDRRNFRRGVRRYGAYDGIDLLPRLRGQAPSPPRSLFFRLQGQAAIRYGEAKLIRSAHRPAQLFLPGSDPGENKDLAPHRQALQARLFAQLSDWESLLPTAPLWQSSPFWNGQSAKHFENAKVRPEPR